MKIEVIDEFGAMPDKEKLKEALFDLMAEIVKHNKKGEYIVLDPGFVKECRYREYLNNSQSGEQLQLQCTWQPADDGASSESTKGL